MCVWLCLEETRLCVCRIKNSIQVLKQDASGKASFTCFAWEYSLRTAMFVHIFASSSLDFKSREGKSFHLTITPKFSLLNHRHGWSCRWQPLLHLLYWFLGSLHLPNDSSLWFVHDPTNKAQPLCLFLSMLSKIHSLHPSKNLKYARLIHPNALNNLQTIPITIWYYAHHYGKTDHNIKFTSTIEVCKSCKFKGPMLHQNTQLSSICCSKSSGWPWTPIDSPFDCVARTKPFSDLLRDEDLHQDNLLPSELYANHYNKVCLSICPPCTIIYLTADCALTSLNLLI